MRSPGDEIYRQAVSTPRQVPNAPDRDAYTQAIAGEVRAALARMKVRQTELQDAFGWGRTFVNKRVNGEIPWGIPELTQLCDYLDIDLGLLLGRAKRIASEQAETFR